jgi:hypothetical protein
VIEKIDSIDDPTKLQTLISTDAISCYKTGKMRLTNLIEQEPKMIKALVSEAALSCYQKNVTVDELLCLVSECKGPLIRIGKFVDSGKSLKDFVQTLPPAANPEKIQSKLVLLRASTIGAVILDPSQQTNNNVKGRTSPSLGIVI